MGVRRAHAPGKSDVVYTQPWVAEDMIAAFQPTGVVMDPCRGDGVFHSRLPEWSPFCEVTEGQDFFAWREPVDWLIGNPPYSLTRPWLRHSYTLAHDIVYLVPCRNIWSADGLLREMHDYGGIVRIRLYGTGSQCGFPMGNAVGAFHVQAGYRGETRIEFARDRRKPMQARLM